MVRDWRDELCEAIDEELARREGGHEPETGFSRMNLRPIEVAADVTAAVATLGASVLLKRLFR